MWGRWFFGLVCLLAIAGGAAGGQEPLTADQVIAKAEARHAGVTDYECVVDTESRLGEKEETTQVRVWFKKPALLRIRVLRGSNKGSEIVVDREGEIRARKGGLLKAFVARVKPDDSRLRTLRGTPVTDVEWGAFYRRFRERSMRPGSDVTVAPRARADALYDVVLSYQEEGKGVREVYRIDPQLWSLTAAEILEDGVRVSSATFSETKIDSGLKDDWFRF